MLQRRFPTAMLGVAVAAALLAAAPVAHSVDPDAESGQAAGAPRRLHTPEDSAATEFVRARHLADTAAMTAHRPGYAFWQHIFTIADGSIVYGSGADGRLLAVFPAQGDWHREGRWIDPTLAGALDGHRLPRSLDDRRDYVAAILEETIGVPVLHNPARGRFLMPNVPRYGPFLSEWGAIYERFAVPADVGLSQALIESGLDGTRRSEASAIGFCQWLRGNWRHLNRLAPVVIEVHNQTTQAAYCAAYLTVLAAKYGSFIPALSEHHSGGTNVGRTLINGERLGGGDTREQYFLGADMARDLRLIAPRRYSDIYRTYGPRSYRYAEMVFGNRYNVVALLADTPQRHVYAMRTTRALSLAEIARRTRLSRDEVQRYNPALVRQVPRGATLYLPAYDRAFGRDVTFWHRPAPRAFAAALEEFVGLEPAPATWDDKSFLPTLTRFQRRFMATNSEEGIVMATVLAYVAHEIATSGRGRILAEFRNSDEIRNLFEQAQRERAAARLAPTLQMQ